MSGKDDVFQTYISSAYMSGSGLDDGTAGQGNQVSDCSAHKLDENSSESVSMGMSADTAAITEQAHSSNIPGVALVSYPSTGAIESNQLCQFHEASGGSHSLDSDRHLGESAGASSAHAHPHDDLQGTATVAAQHHPQADHSQSDAHGDLHGFDSVASSAAAGASSATPAGGMPDSVMLAVAVEPQLEHKTAGAGDGGGPGGGFGPELVGLLNQLEVHVRGGPGREDELRTGILQARARPHTRARKRSSPPFSRLCISTPPCLMLCLSVRFFPSSRAVSPNH